MRFSESLEVFMGNAWSESFNGLVSLSIYKSVDDENGQPRQTWNIICCESTEHKDAPPDLDLDPIGLGTSVSPETDTHPSKRVGSSFAHINVTVLQSISDHADSRFVVSADGRQSYNHLHTRRGFVVFQHLPQSGVQLSAGWKNWRQSLRAAEKQNQMEGGNSINRQPTNGFEELD